MQATSTNMHAEHTTYCLTPPHDAKYTGYKPLRPWSTSLHRTSVCFIRMLHLKLNVTIEHLFQIKDIMHIIGQVLWSQQDLAIPKCLV